MSDVQQTIQRIDEVIMYEEDLDKYDVWLDGDELDEQFTDEIPNFRFKVTTTQVELCNSNPNK